MKNRTCFARRGNSVGKQEKREDQRQHADGACSDMQRGEVRRKVPGRPVHVEEGEPSEQDREDGGPEMPWQRCRVEEDPFVHEPDEQNRDEAEDE
jgi:hypothetical protein